MPNMYVAIVDAYSAANQYAPECKRRGYQCIHVQSSPDVPLGLAQSFIINDFAESVHHQDFNNTLNKLKKLSLCCLFAGTESGVELADRLSEALALPTNGSAKSQARRNKFLMAQEIKQAGLPIARQIQTDKLNEVLLWMRKSQLPRIVLKPLHSAGTDHVIICNSEQQVTKAFDTIINKRNAMNLINDMVLAQEFLQGEEYVVNSVSCRGKHSLVGLWRYHKKQLPNGASFYDYDDLVTKVGPHEKRLVEYVHNILNALAIQYGPSHAEVMATTNGPILVEVAARIDGMCNLKFQRECLQQNQIDLTLDAYINPEKFVCVPIAEYASKKVARVVTFCSTQHGRIIADDGLQAIKLLKSFNSINVRYKIGDSLVLTEDLFNYPGFVSLTHDDESILQSDYQKIRELEKVGLFTVTT